MQKNKYATHHDSNEECRVEDEVVVEVGGTCDILAEVAVAVVEAVAAAVDQRLRLGQVVLSLQWRRRMKMIQLVQWTTTVSSFEVVVDAVALAAAAAAVALR